MSYLKKFTKLRVVDTKFWNDNYVLDLTPEEKLVYLYLITNPATDISGVYEMSVRLMAIQTGLSVEDIEKKHLKKFEKDGKIVYKYGWIAIKNFWKHQTLNPKVIIGIKNGISKAPQELRDFIGYTESMIGYDILSQDKDKDKDKGINTEETSEKQILNKNVASVIDSFKEVNPAYKKWFGNKTQRSAAENLIKTHGFENVLKVVSVLKKTNSMEFFPVIMTPLNLEDKWSKLENALIRAGKGKGSGYVL